MYVRHVPCAIFVFLSLLLTPGVSRATPFVFPPAAETSVQAVASINSEAVASPSNLSISLETGTSTAASISGSEGSAHASVDLAAGILRLDAASTHGFTASATGWEFITFGGSGTVSFGFDVDGELSNQGLAAGLAGVSAAVRIYDVTDWDSYFGTLGGQQFSAFNGSGSPFPYIEGNAFAQAAVSRTSALCSSQFIDAADCTIDAFGTIVPVNLALTGSFDALDGRLYLLELSLSSSTFNPTPGLRAQSSDFSHTATFNFTDLGGLTFESASGAFLSEQAATPVPEPASGVLLGAGLAAAWKARRKARRG